MFGRDIFYKFSYFPYGLVRSTPVTVVRRVTSLKVIVTFDFGETRIDLQTGHKCLPVRPGCQDNPGVFMNPGFSND